MSQLFARKLVSLVVATLVSACVFVLPSVVAPAPASAQPADWSAPALVNATEIELRPGNQDLRLDPARDYRLKIVQTLTDPGGLVISGGRNVVLSGGQIRVPDAGTALDRRGLYLKAQTGTIHIEGLHIAGAHLAEGINLDQRAGATVQFRNIRIDRVQGTQAGHHADLIQTWAGPKTLRVDGLQGESNYQGMFLLPQQLFPGAHLENWEFSNVDVRMTADAGYGFWKEAGHAVSLNDVYLSREGGSTWKSFWPNASEWQGASFGVPFSSVFGTKLPGMTYADSQFGDAGGATTTAPPTTAAPTTIAPPTTAPPTTAAPVTSPPTTTGPVTGPTVPVTVAQPSTTVPQAPPTTVPSPSGNGSVPTPSVAPRVTSGYWQVASDGGVFSFGDARFHGSTGAMALNRPVTGMAATDTGNGYWLVASDGGIFAFGDAGFHGSTGAMSLNKPIVGMASTPTGNGYWLVASDGGIFAFGDAGFHGSTGAMSLNKPISAMASTRSGRGYWLVASDGGIFSFGDAQFFGSASRLATAPIAGVRPASSGNGYALDASNGGVFAFGEAQFRGSVSGSLNAPIVGSAGF